MHSLIVLKECNLPQNRQPFALIGDSNQQVDDFVGELTFQNHVIYTLYEMEPFKSPRFWGLRAQICTRKGLDIFFGARWLEESCIPLCGYFGSRHPWDSASHCPTCVFLSQTWWVHSLRQAPTLNPEPLT